jgi:hypothetical protein
MKRELMKSVSRSKMLRNACLMRLNVVSRDQLSRLWLTSVFLADLSKELQLSRELYMLVSLHPKKRDSM